MTTRIDPATPAGTVVVCCHHEELVEILTAPAGVRSEYIDAYKPAHERATRHAAFRVLATRERLPVPVLEALRAYHDARRAYDAAYRAYHEAGRAYDEAYRAYHEADRVYDAAYRAYHEADRVWRKVLRAHWPEVVAVVRAEHPDLPVDWTTGHLVFPTPEAA